MSQQANSSPPPTPNAMKRGRKGIAALLAVLVSLGAFAGVTVAYVILPYYQGGNNNGGGCMTNCRGSSCVTGCLQGVINGSNNPSSPYVQLVNVNATSSNMLSMTLRAIGASELNFYSVKVIDNSTGWSTFESCQQCGFFSKWTSVLAVQATGILVFTTGDSYTVRLLDSGNSSTYYFHF